MSASRFNRHIGNKKGMALRWRASWPKSIGPLPDVLTRQRKRAARREAAHKFMRENYGGESRSRRRAMALVLAKRKGSEYPGRLNT